MREALDCFHSFNMFSLTREEWRPFEFRGNATSTCTQSPPYLLCFAFSYRYRQTISLANTEWSLQIHPQIYITDKYTLSADVRVFTARVLAASEVFKVRQWLWMSGWRNVQSCWRAVRKLLNFSRSIKSSVPPVTRRPFRGFVFAFFFCLTFLLFRFVLSS